MSEISLWSLSFACPATKVKFFGGFHAVGFRLLRIASFALFSSLSAGGQSLDGLRQLGARKSKLRRYLSITATLPYPPASWPAPVISTP